MVTSNMKMSQMFLFVMMMKRNVRCHRMRILVIYLSHHLTNSGGLLGRDNYDIKDEMKSLHDNHTFDLVKLPKGKKALDNR